MQPVKMAIADHFSPKVQDFKKENVPNGMQEVNFFF